jgi:integrase
MASLKQEKNGTWMIQWVDRTRRPFYKSESTKTSKKREAKALMNRLEQEYIQGTHDPWECPWYRRHHHSDDEALLVALEHYIADKRTSGEWRENTSVHTTKRLRQYVQQLGPSRSCESVTGKEIFETVSRAGIASATMHSDIIKLRSFWNWMHKQGYLSAKVTIPQVKIQKKLPVYLTTEQIELATDYMRSEIERRSKHIRSADYSTEWHVDAVWMAARTGLRLTELLKLRLEDIKDTTILVGGSYDTKSMRQRIIPAMDRAVDVIVKYSDPEYRQSNLLLSKSDLLFGRGSSISGARLSARFSQACRNACSIKRTFHHLRHSFAYWYLNAESEKNKQFRLVSLMEILGHSSIEVTMVYSKLSPDDLRL